MLSQGCSSGVKSEASGCASLLGKDLLLFSSKQLIDKQVMCTAEVASDSCCKACNT